MVCLPCAFKILLTVFNQSYNCQTSHYLGRNRLPKPFLILPSLIGIDRLVEKTRSSYSAIFIRKSSLIICNCWFLKICWRTSFLLSRRSFMKKNNSWNIKCLVQALFAPSTQQPSIVYWRLSDFKRDNINKRHIVFKLNV